MVNEMLALLVAETLFFHLFVNKRDYADFSLKGTCSKRHWILLVQNAPKVKPFAS
jgi:hypothetical protein